MNTSTPWCLTFSSSLLAVSLLNENSAGIVISFRSVHKVMISPTLVLIHWSSEVWSVTVT